MLGHLRNLLTWLHQDERGQWEQLAIPVLGSIFSSLFGGGGQASSDAGAAREIAREQVANQRRILDYLLGKREKLYDPLEEKEVIPRLTERMQTAPFYARNALQQARNLRTPMRLM